MFYYFFKIISKRMPKMLFICIPISVITGFCTGIGLGAMVAIFQFFDKTATIASNTALPLFFSKITNFFGLEYNPVNLLIILFFVILTRAILLYISNVFSFFNTVSYRHNIKKEILSNLMLSQWKYYQSLSNAKITTNILVQTERLMGFAHFFVSIITDFILIVAYIIVASIISLKTVMGVALLSIGLGIFYLFISSMTKNLGEHLSIIHFRAQHYMDKALSGVKMLKAISAGDEVTKIFGKKMMDLEKNQKKFRSILEFSKVIQEPITFVIVALIGFFFVKSNLGLSTFFILSYIFFNLYGKLFRLITTTGFLSNQYSALCYCEQMRDESKFHREKSGSIKFKELKKGIRFSNVHFKYKKDFPVLKGIDLFFEKGKIIVLKGESGSGKTTILDLLLRLWTAQEGQVSIDDVSIDEVDINSFRDKIGYVSQESVLFDDTIADNICLKKPDATLEEIKEAAKMAFCHNFIEELPQKYDTFVGGTTDKLSIGEKQRISLARALIYKPEILILDEPTSALDMESEQRIKERLSLLKDKMTIIIVSHRPALLEIADKVYDLKEGKVQGIVDDQCNHSSISV